MTAALTHEAFPIAIPVADRLPTVAFGPVTPGWGSWEWVGEDPDYFQNQALRPKRRRAFLLWQAELQLNELVQLATCDRMLARVKRRNSFLYRIMRSSNPVAGQGSGKPIFRVRIAGCVTRPDSRATVVNFPLPDCLTRLLAAGIWPSAEGPSMNEQQLRPIISTDRVRRFAAEETLICLQHPPFPTIAEVRAAGGAGDFWERFGIRKFFQPALPSGTKA